MAAFRKRSMRKLLRQACADLIFAPAFFVA
jgi:hypothetical protein